jgi:hypothetical protein
MPGSERRCRGWPAEAMATRRTNKRQESSRRHRHMQQEHFSGAASWINSNDSRCSWARSRPSPESHSISGTEHRDLRKISVLGHGCGTRKASGGEVFRRNHGGGHRCRHFVVGLHPQFLLRCLVKCLDRSGLGFGAGQFPDVRDLFGDCAGLSERERQRGFRRRWGRWGRSRLVTRTAW